MAKQAILATEEELELDFTAGADENEDSGEALDMNFGFGEDETPEDDDPETDTDEDGDDEADDEGDDDGEDKETEESDDEDGEETDEEEEEGEPDEDGEDDTPEAEGEEESEEEEPEDDGKAKAKKSSHMIPKTRFDQVLQKNKALEAKLAALTDKSGKDGDEGEDDGAEAYDFDAKEAEYQDLILDGETEKAAKLRREIRAEERKEIMQEVTKTTSATTKQTQVQDALQDAAQEWYDAYPPLDPAHADFDKDLTADIVRVRNGLIASGSNAVDALNEAVELQLARRGLIEPEGQTQEKPKPAARKKRKKSTVAAKLKAQRSQPAEQGGEGAATRASEDEVDLDKLSDEEFEALPPKTLARLRGDIL